MVMGSLHIYMVVITVRIESRFITEAINFVKRDNTPNEDNDEWVSFVAQEMDAEITNVLKQSTLRGMGKHTVFY